MKPPCAWTVHTRDGARPCGRPSCGRFVLDDDRLAEDPSAVLGELCAHHLDLALTAGWRLVDVDLLEALRALDGAA